MCNHKSYLWRIVACQDSCTPMVSFGLHSAMIVDMVVGNSNFVHYID